MPDSQIFGTDDDRRLSVDGTLEPAPEQPSASASRNRDTPYSPRPRLFDNLPLPEGPVASDVLSEADYRRLRSNAFRPSVMAGPLLVSSFLAYFAPRVLPSRSGNPNTLRSGIFLFSLTSMLTISTYQQLNREVSGARHRAQERVRPRTADGQVILPDEPSTADKYADAATSLGATIGNAELRQAMAAKSGASAKGEDAAATDDLASLGKAKARTRWAKGKGLEGEVEEENEMRDTFFRPGVPRKPA